MERIMYTVMGGGIFLGLLYYGFFYKNAYQAALKHYNANRFDKALAIGLRGLPKNMNVYDKVELLYLISIIYENREKVDEAIKLYGTYIDQLDEFPMFWNGYGLTAMKHSDLVLAEICFRKVIELDPATTIGYYNLGYVCLSTERYEEAVKLFTKQIEHNFNHASSYTSRAIAYAMIGDYEQAKSSLLKTNIFNQGQVENAMKQVQNIIDINRIGFDPNRNDEDSSPIN